MNKWQRLLWPISIFMALGSKGMSIKLLTLLSNPELFAYVLESAVEDHGTLTPEEASSMVSAIIGIRTNSPTPSQVLQTNSNSHAVRFSTPSLGN